MKQNLYSVVIQKKAVVMVLASSEQNAIDITSDVEESVFQGKETEYTTEMMGFHGDVKLPKGVYPSSRCFADDGVIFTVRQAAEIHRANAPDARQRDLFEVA